MDVRDEKQSQIVERYFSKNHKQVAIVSATGTGKSFIALKIIERLDPDKILILVNSTDLRDKNWEDEFRKFGMLDTYNNIVTMQTYQYVYKQKSDLFHLTEKSIVIMDEIDFIADTDKLANTMALYDSHRILGLTGFITEDKKEWFEENLPVIQEYTAHEAQKDKLLNTIHYVFVKYDLSKNPKDIKVEYKKGGELAHFYQSENAAYDYAQSKFASLIAQKEMAKKDYYDDVISDVELVKKIDSLDYQLRYAINNRSNLLLQSIASADLASRLIKHIQDIDKNHKIIVFSKRTSQSEKITTVAYNGKTSKSRAPKIFKAFLSGEIQVLGVCDKLDRGVNVPGLNYAIFESFYGSDTKATQRFGRMLRLQPDEVATVYVLLPYYMAKKDDGTYANKPTQQVTWAAKMLRSTVVNSKEIWDYRNVKT